MKKKLFLVFVGCTLGSLGCSDGGGYKFNKQSSGIYELDMQNNVGAYSKEAGEKVYSLRHWQMEIPNAYVRSRYGRNGAPNYFPETNSSNKFGITLFAVIDEETQTLIPDANIKSGKHSHNRVAIDLRNGRAIKRIRQAVKDSNVCLTRPYVNKEILGRKRVNQNPCDVSKALCGVDMYIDGWPLNVSLPREHYFSDPQYVCDMVLAFLNDKTTSRDSLLDLDDYQEWNKDND